MSTHHFTLIVDGELQDESVVNGLFESGCDDALVGSRDGVQFLDFDRDAASLGEAVLSAVADAQRVNGVQVVRVAGLATLREIAERTGRRQKDVLLLVSGARGPGGFPSPITDPEDKYPLWRCSDVEHWFGNELGERVALQETRPIPPRPPRPSLSPGVSR